MILSRFWFFLLTAASIVCVAAALLAASLIDDHYRTAAVNDLVRDRFEIEQTLKLDARARLDAIAPIAANPDVRSALRRAGGRRAPAELDEALVTSLRQTLVRLNGQLDQMSGDLVFAVDQDGWIVAAIAPTNPPAGAGLGQFPLVRRALEGYLSDDVWVYNDSVYRMAARPVVDGGQYVGALIHGKRYDDQLAQLLSQRLGGASVGFFRGSAMFAGHMPSGAPRREDMGQLLGPEVLGDERFTSGERTEPLDLPAGGLAVYSQVTGAARHAGVGYSVGRPVRTLGPPWAIFDQAGGERWAALPWIPLGGGGLALFLLAMFWTWVEHDRPLSKLKRASLRLKDSPEARFIITDFGGRYRAIANAANEAIDAAAAAGGAAAPGRPAANLDAILGPTDAASSPAFFGFAGQDAGPVDLPEVPLGPAGGLPPLGTPAGGLPPLGGAPRPAAPTPPAAAKAPPPKPPAPPARPAAPPRTERKLKSTLLGVAPPDDDDDDDDDEESTMVARVPDELLAQAAGAAGDEETAHFREVFAQFKAMKEQCGEPTTGLTFEKFRVTLDKNREQITKRHGARRVRFTVYTKNGKAALKATPIKD